MPRRCSHKANVIVLVKLRPCQCWFLVFLPLRGVLVQPAHFNDRALVGGVFFWRQAQWAAGWQIKTALCWHRLVVQPWVTTETDTRTYTKQHWCKETSLAFIVKPLNVVKVMWRIRKYSRFIAQIRSDNRYGSLAHQSPLKMSYLITVMWVKQLYNGNTTN
jgi:hypothetical protein